MNLILLFDDDFIGPDRVRLDGRRREHVLAIHRVAEGDELVVGLAGGRVGRGVVSSLDPLELAVTLTSDPPDPLPLTLVLALPRPKVLNRVVAGAASLGIKRIYLINAWRVEKSYWKSPRLTDDNLRLQSILGLEQSRDTALPVIETRRFFRSFVEDELPAIARDTIALVPHPCAAAECPRDVRNPVTLVIGPEGGFIEAEIASLERAGLTPVTLGPRVLRVETVVPAVVGRLM